MGQLLAGQDLELGNLHASRDLTYVTDTVAGMLAAATDPVAIGETFVLGSGSSTTVEAIARRLLSVLAPEAGLTSVAARQRPRSSEVQVLQADAKKAADLLHWRPEVTLADGLARVVEFMQEHP